MTLTDIQKFTWIFKLWKKKYEKKIFLPRSVQDTAWFTHFAFANQTEKRCESRIFLRIFRKKNILLISNKFAIFYLYLRGNIVLWNVNHIRRQAREMSVGLWHIYRIFVRNAFYITSVHTSVSYKFMLTYWIYYLVFESLRFLQFYHKFFTNFPQIFHKCITKISQIYH